MDLDGRSGWGARVKSSTVALCALAMTVGLGVAGAVFAEAPGDGLPEGPGKEVLVRACTGCHEVYRVKNK